MGLRPCLLIHTKVGEKSLDLRNVSEEFGLIQESNPGDPLRCILGSKVSVSHLRIQSLEGVGAARQLWARPHQTENGPNSFVHSHILLLSFPFLPFVSFPLSSLLQPFSYSEHLGPNKDWKRWNQVCPSSSWSPFGQLRHPPPRMNDRRPPEIMSTFKRQ